MWWSGRWGREFVFLDFSLYSPYPTPPLSMWYLTLFFSVFAMSWVNIIDKTLSTSTDKSLALIYRYSASITLLAWASLIFWVPYITGVYALICIGLGVLNYLINLVMYRGLERIHTWVFFVIGYLYLVFLFFINIYLFGSSEVLSWSKIALWWAFVSVVFSIMYLWGSGTQKGSSVGYLYAFICAVGWTLSSVLWFSEGLCFIVNGPDSQARYTREQKQPHQCLVEAFSLSDLFYFSSLTGISQPISWTLWASRISSWRHFLGITFSMSI